MGKKAKKTATIESPSTKMIEDVKAFLMPQTWEDQLVHALEIGKFTYNVKKLFRYIDAIHKDTEHCLHQWLTERFDDLYDLLMPIKAHLKASSLAIAEKETQERKTARIKELYRIIALETHDYTIGLPATIKEAEESLEWAINNDLDPDTIEAKQEFISLQYEGLRLCKENLLTLREELSSLDPSYQPLPLE